MLKDTRNYSSKIGAQDKANHAIFAILSIAMAILISGCTTSQQSNVWADMNQALRNDRAMKASGMMPASIDCMMDTTASNPRPTYFVKITYKTRPPNMHWRWGVGEEDEMQVYANTATREGLKRIQTRHMLDPNSGKRASCSLWHG